jgi:hypothetical protein
MEKTFIRKTNINTFVKIYDQFIRELFKITFSSQIEDKSQAIRAKYYEIADPDIEKDDWLIQRMNNLKKVMESKEKHYLSKYEECLNQLLIANIIYQETYEKLRS